MRADLPRLPGRCSVADRRRRRRRGRGRCSPTTRPSPPSTRAATPRPASSPLRAAVAAAARASEPEAVAPLLDAARLSGRAGGRRPPPRPAARDALRERALSAGREGLVQGLMQEFSLSSQEGVALMCLAEALLRIPDAPTRDALIRDKLGDGDWQSHLGHSGSLFVNAATWGLVVTGQLVSTHDEGGRCRRSRVSWRAAASR